MNNNKNRKEKIKNGLVDLLNNKDEVARAAAAVGLFALPLNLNDEFFKKYIRITPDYDRKNVDFENSLHQFNLKERPYYDEGDEIYNGFESWMIDTFYINFYITEMKWLINEILRVGIRHCPGSGTIGEQVKGIYTETIICQCFQDCFGAVPYKSQGYDKGIDLVLNGKKYDIKTINRTCDWKPGYSQVNYHERQASNNENETDYLILSSYNFKSGRLEIINIIPYPEDFNNNPDWKLVEDRVNNAGHKIEGRFWMLVNNN